MLLESGLLVDGIRRTVLVSKHGKLLDLYADHSTLTTIGGHEAPVDKCVTSIDYLGLRGGERGPSLESGPSEEREKIIQKSDQRGARLGLLVSIPRC